MYDIKFLLLIYFELEQLFDEQEADQKNFFNCNKESNINK